MFREKLLKLFLSIPVASQFAEFIVAIFIKDQPFKIALKNLSLQQKKSKAREKNLYSALGKFLWLIQISAPSGEKAKLWGDTYFSHEIANSLRKLDQEVKIIYRNQNISDFIQPNSIILNIRGLLPLTVSPKAINLIWIISHPDQVTKRELQKYDLAFAASSKWANSKSKKWDLNITTLLQATNPDVFNTYSSQANVNNNILFVGNSRGEFRKSVKVASSKVKNLIVIGSGWNKFLPKNIVTKNFIENSELSGEYRSSKFVLNDHWEDMSKNGFISNRLFDAASSGARIISDYVDGIAEIFNKLVLEYKNVHELETLLDSDLTSNFANQSVLDINAKKIQSEHNFDKRAEVLLASVNDLTTKLHQSQ